MRSNILARWGTTFESSNIVCVYIAYSKFLDDRGIGKIIFYYNETYKF